MQTYWLKFTDGSAGHCDGESAYDAVMIAEHLTEKVVAVEKEHKYRPEQSESVKKIPYPSSPMIWQFDHPIHGKCPDFCYGGSMCHGCTSCPKSPSCTS